MNFQASKGWLESFLQRHKFVSRRPTTVCQKPPEEYEQKIIDFIIYLSKLQTEQTFGYIYAADETSVALNLHGGLCVDEKGKKEVSFLNQNLRLLNYIQISVLNTGHDKMHITVMLTARSDGYKCKPFVLLKRVRQDPAIIAKYKSKLSLCWKGQTWMNDELTDDYLRNIFGPTFFHKRLLVWDSFRCHISQRTKKVLRELKIETAVIPGGCTKFIQVKFKKTVLNVYNYLRHLTFVGTNPSKLSCANYLTIGWQMEISC